LCGVVVLHVSNLQHDPNKTNKKSKKICVKDAIVLDTSPGVTLEPPLREGETQRELALCATGETTNPVLPKDSCQMIIDTVLEKLIVNAVNRIQLVPTDIPFKQNVWAGWYTLPCVDGGDCPIGEL
jgi:hypothetical protein